MHNEQGAASSLVHYHGVSLDGYSPANWTPTKIASLRSQCAYWKAAGFQVSIVMDALWGANMAGHMRDIYQVTNGQVDLIRGPNEPDINGFTGAQVAAWLLACQEAKGYLNGVQIAGPDVSNYYDPTTVAWVAAFIAAGGARAVDVATFHAYGHDQHKPDAASGGVANQIVNWKAAFPGKPVAVTEWSITKTWYNTLYGANSWTDAGAAARYAEALAAAVAQGVPIYLYQGPYSSSTGTNNDDGVAITYWANGQWNVSTGLTAMGAALDSSIQ